MALTGWTYKSNAIEIDGSIDGAKTNFPIPITISYDSSKMKSDYGDIRFTASDETTLLKYSLESYDETSALFLVQIPSLPASPSSVLIYAFSGNTSATTTSDPNSIYLEYDPLTESSIDSKWTVSLVDNTTSTTMVSESSDGLKFSITSGAADWWAGTVYTAPMAKIAFPSGDFIANVELLSYDNLNNESAGIGIYQDKDNAFIGYRGYWDHNGIEFDSFVGAIGSRQQYNSVITSPIYLQLKKIGTDYTFSYSTDGITYTPLQTNFDGSLISPTGLILFAKNWGAGQTTNSIFKNFKVLQTTSHMPTVGTITGWNIPTADFITDKTSGSNPLTIQFTDTSTGTPTSWSWNFGDGNTSTEQNPSHTYTVGGTYTVTLTATNANGSNTKTRTSYITVTNPPVTDFIANYVEGVAPLSILFTDQSIFSPTSWLWDFGDGHTSTLQNPTHKYTSVGTFTVTLTATNANGSNTKTRTNYVTITSPITVTVNHSYSPPKNPTEEEKVNKARWDEKHTVNIDIPQNISGTIHNIYNTYFNVMDYGAKGDGTTDDTNAIIMAMDAAVASGGGTIYFPRPTAYYNLSGALDTSKGGNAIIPLPNITRDSTTEQIVLKFLGESPPAPDYTLIADNNGNYPPVKGVVLYAKTAASGTKPSIFGSPNGTWSNIYTIFENLTIRQKNNPDLIGFKLDYCTSASVKNCNVDVDALNPFSIVQPTNSNASGIILPHTDNSGRATIQDTFITGYFRGVEMYEHSTLQGDVFIQSCYEAIAVHGTGHAMKIDGHLCLQWCPYYLVFVAESGLKAYIQIDFFDIEEAADSQWNSLINHINDSSNMIYGVITMAHRAKTNVGPETGNLTKNGGTNIIISNTV